jgi:Ca-activated chloride channel family protein
VVAEWVLIGALVVAGLTEWIHARRSRHWARLAFGPTQRPAGWARLAPLVRVLSFGGLAWGLTSLLYIEPKIFRAQSIPDNEKRHLVLILDVSPSMRLQDAGPKLDESRRKRAAAIMESFFARVPVEQYLVSVVACYNGAKPVVEDTMDLEVVRNILDELPMEYAFESGKTDIFAGLEEAFRLARPWQPKSTTVMLLSDGDSVPATGMAKRPASVANLVVVGVGDTKSGRFIDGRQSRQDASTLRQIAVRLRGTYHNGNEKQLGSDLLKQISQRVEKNPFANLTRREYALIACGVASLLLAGLPWLLHLAGTAWRPGVPADSPQTVGRARRRPSPIPRRETVAP